MADNTTFTPGSGATIAAKDLGSGVLAQRNVLIFGTTDVSAANPLPVVLPAGFALDATLTGGNTKAIARGGAKGTTTAADVTSTAAGANHNALDTILYTAAGAVANIDTTNVTITTITPPSNIRAEQLTVGTTATAGSSLTVQAGVFVKADKNNTGNVFVGPTGLTTSSGLILYPGDQVYVPCANHNQIGYIASAANQKVYCLGA